jgi:hypothetical protein
MSTPPRSPVRMNSDRAPPLISRPRSRSESNPGSSAANPIRLLGDVSDDYDFTSRISNDRNTGGSLFSRSPSPNNASSNGDDDGQYNSFYDDMMTDAMTGHNDYHLGISPPAMSRGVGGGGQSVIHRARFTPPADRNRKIQQAIDDYKDYYDRLRSDNLRENEIPPVVEVINKNTGIYPEFDEPYLLKYKEEIFPITNEEEFKITGLLLGYKNNQPKQMGGRMRGRKSKKSKKSRKSKKSKKSRKHKRTRRHK